MMWFYFAILSVLIFSVTNILDKYVVTEHIKKPLYNTLVSGLVISSAAVPIYLLVGTEQVSAWTAFLGISLGVIFFFANLFFFRGIFSDEVSRAMPILLGMTPLFILLIAVAFFGEVFTLYRYVGILLLLVSSFMVTMRKDISIKLSPAFFSMVVSAVLYAAYHSLSKYVLGFMGYWTAYFWISVGMFLVAFPMVLIYRGTFMKILMKKRRASSLCVFNESVGIIADLSFIIALSLGPLTLVSSVIFAQPVFVFIFASVLSLYRPHIIREEMKKSVLALKIMAIVLMVAGLFLII